MIIKTRQFWTTEHIKKKNIIVAIIFSKKLFELNDPSRLPSYLRPLSSPRLIFSILRSSSRIFLFLPPVLCAVDMSEYNAATSPGSAASSGGQAALGNGEGGIKKDAFADAVQRARQVRDVTGRWSPVAR